jgi:hypothetical protein
MPTLNDRALHGLPGRFVDAVLPETEASAAPLLLQYLTLVGNAIGRGPHFRAGADEHYTSIYTLVIGPTSSGAKGTSYGFAKDIAFAADPEWAETCVESGLSTAEGLIYRVRDAVYADEGPREESAGNGRIRVKLPEAIDPGVSDKRVMVVEREFSSMLRRSNNRESTLSSTLRNAWDGDVLGTMTRNNSMRAHNAHVSLVGHITPQELSRDFDKTELFNGFLNRVLVVWSERSKLLPNGGRVDPSIRAKLIGDTRSAIEFARGVREMRRTEAAEQRWAELYPELTRDLPGLLGAAGGRRHVHVMKLALLYALLDHRREINVEHLNAALAAWTYCQDSLVEVFGDSTGDRLADKVLNVLRDAAPEPLSLKQLRDATGRNYTAEQTGAALNALATFGLAEREPTATGGRGRPAERWRATTRQEHTHT